MICLEELILSLKITGLSKFIDNNHLESEIVNYLPKLQTFQFNTRTHCENLNNEIFLPLNIGNMVK